MSGSVWKVVDYSGSFWKETCRRFQIDVLLGNGWNCGEGSILDGSRRYGLCYHVVLAIIEMDQALQH